MENKNELQQAQSRIAHMEMLFMSEEAYAFDCTVAEAISDACDADGEEVLYEIKAGVEAFEAEYEAMQKGMTLYDRCEARDREAGCDQRERMANRNRDILWAHMLLQSMTDEEADEEIIAGLNMNLEHAELDEQTQKQLLNSLNQKAAWLFAQSQSYALHQENLPCPVSENSGKRAVSRAAAMYMEAAKQLADCKPEGGEDLPEKIIDAKTLGFLSAAMTKAQDAALECAYPLYETAEMRRCDAKISKAERERDDLKAKLDTHCSELEWKLANHDDGKPKIGSLQNVLTGIGSVVAGYLSTQFVLNTVVKGIGAMMANLEASSLLGAIGTLLGAVGGGWLSLLILVITFIVAAVGVYVLSNALILKIREMLPAAKRSMLEAALAKAKMKAVLEQARSNREEALELAGKKIELLTQQKAAAEAAALELARKRAKAELEASGMTIRERILAPCRKAMALAKKRWGETGARAKGVSEKSGHKAASWCKTGVPC